MKSRGLYELKRHFQRKHHLRADQSFRARYHPSKIRGSDGRTLYGSKLEAEKELFMHLDVTELDHKCPFFYDVVEGKPFIFISASSRTLIQIELLFAVDFSERRRPAVDIGRILDPGGSVDGSFCEHR